MEEVEENGDGRPYKDALSLQPEFRGRQLFGLHSGVAGKGLTRFLTSQGSCSRTWICRDQRDSSGRDMTRARPTTP